jgi:hypothetical protein
VSDRRNRGKIWVHELQVRVFRGGRSLGEAAEVLPFLGLLQSGAVLFLNGRRFGALEELLPEAVAIWPCSASAGTGCGLAEA